MVITCSNLFRKNLRISFLLHFLKPTVFTLMWIDISVYVSRELVTHYFLPCTQHFFKPTSGSFSPPALALRMILSLYPNQNSLVISEPESETVPVESQSQDLTS